MISKLVSFTLTIACLFLIGCGEQKKSAPITPDTPSIKTEDHDREAHEHAEETKEEMTEETKRKADSLQQVKEHGHAH